VNFLPLIALYTIEIANLDSERANVNGEIEMLERMTHEAHKRLAEIDESKRVASGAKAYCELQVKRQEINTAKAEGEPK